MLDFSKIYNTDITVRALNIYGNPTPIIPPDSCNCTKGMRLYSRFFYVTSGEIVFDAGTPKELHAKSGDILYLPYDVKYYSQWVKGDYGSFITANFIINDPSVVFSTEVCIAASDSSGTYLKLFQRLLDSWTKGSFDSRLEALAIFTETLSRLSKQASESAFRTNYGIISDGIMYIENHFCEEFTVEDLCELCAVSPATFRRHFKEYSHYSPITYRNYLRTKRARELLSSGEYNVTEAALAVGFDDLSYFNKTYRKFFGESPSQTAK